MVDVSLTQAVALGMGNRLLRATMASAMLCLGAPADARQRAPAYSEAILSDAAAFAGHYYLIGVMETGSELLLRPDGSFEWYLSYGALDQFADGTWRRDGPDIVLTATNPAQDRPLFAYLGAEPWSAKAESERVRLRTEEAAEAVRARCPFLTDDRVSSPVDDEVRPANDQDARAAASRALADAVAARTAVEVMARQTMASKDEDRETADKISRTVAAWENARDKARVAAEMAGQDPPELADPQLPELCRLPVATTVDGNAPASWAGGIAVSIIDPASDAFTASVHVTLRFADGNEATLTTSGHDDPDIFEGDVSSPVVGATLAADFAPGRDADFSFAAVSRGVLRFSIDAKQLNAAPFTSMRLRIDGKTLVPEEFGRGRYERANQNGKD